MTVRTLFIRSLILAAKFFFASLIVFFCSKIYYIGRHVLEKSSVSKLLVWMLGGLEMLHGQKSSDEHDYIEGIMQSQDDGHVDQNEGQ